MSSRWMSTARLPSAALVESAMNGDARDLDDLARAWLPHVYRWCHRLGGPGFDAEDSAHEVLVLMCRKLPTLRDPVAFPAWLYGMTRRVLANHRRRAWWKRWVPGATVPDQADEASSPYASLEARRAHGRVWAALTELSDAHRDVLVLCDLEERPGSEAAVLLDIPLGTVKSRLRAARAAFRIAAATPDDNAAIAAGARP